MPLAAMQPLRVQVEGLGAGSVLVAVKVLLWPAYLSGVPPLPAAGKSVSVMVAEAGGVRSTLKVQLVVAVDWRPTDFEDSLLCC
ncbi:hypothetical protein [Streptacidiphilus albus]|uniref:hypothetical protein n=1 Tax=Streptacidiphilus albus TaxID=105425 RepID=UPI00054BD865|nr:hypothetical protein [Streptacidiphilus albus]